MFTNSVYERLYSSMFGIRYNGIIGIYRITLNIYIMKQESINYTVEYWLNIWVPNNQFIQFI